MAQKRPGGGNDEVTGLHAPHSIRKKKQTIDEERKLHELNELREESPVMKKLLRFIEFKEIGKLKKFLTEQGGAIGELSSQMKKKIGKINPFKHVWNSDDLKDFLVEQVRKGDYLGALEFLEVNEQSVLEAWVDDYLEKKNYREAAITIREFAKGKTSKTMDAKTMKIDEEIDAEILGAVDQELIAKNQLPFQPAHDRVWSLVHHQCYLQAADLCDQLNTNSARGQTIEERRQERRDTIPAPMVFEETPDDTEKRHEEELLQALPKTAAEMKKVFKDLPDLISNYHHLARIDEGDVVYLSALKATFEPFVDRLFEQNKVVIQENGMIDAQEELLGVVDDLGYLGMHLYINHRSNENKLYLMAAHEADEEYYTEVDLRNLSGNDIILDEENFTELEPQTLRRDDEPTISGRETTVTREPMKYTWTSKVITLKPEKAEELRRAA